MKMSAKSELRSVETDTSPQLMPEHGLLHRATLALLRASLLFLSGLVHGFSSQLDIRWPTCPIVVHTNPSFPAPARTPASVHPRTPSLQYCHGITYTTALLFAATTVLTVFHRPHHPHHKGNTGMFSLTLERRLDYLPSALYLRVLCIDDSRRKQSQLPLCYRIPFGIGTYQAWG